MAGALGPPRATVRADRRRPRMNMRVLTVGSMYPPHHLGGYELVWQSAVRFLRGRGHEVCVLASDYRRGDLPEEDPGVRRELRSYWREHEFPRLRLTQRLGLERHNAQVLDLVMGRFDPDVVLWWAMGGLSMSLIEHVRRRGTPAAGVICEDWLLSGPILDGWQSLFAGRRRRLAPLGERLTGVPCQVDLAAVGPSLFPSESIRRRTRARGVPLPRTEVVNQGVDPALFPPAPPRTWRWRLLYVGRLDPRKGIDIALRAMALLPDAAELQVLGAG